MNEQLSNQFSFEEVQMLRQLTSLIDRPLQDNLVTLGFFRSEYEKHIKKNRSIKYLLSVRLAFNHLEKFFNPQRILSAISLRDAELFIDELKNSAPSGYRVYYRTIKAGFNKAIDWGYIGINPFVKVKLEKKQKCKPEYLDRDQMSEIRGRIRSEILRDAVEVAFNTGMRLGELINLKWENVDFKNGIIIIGDDEFRTKARKQRFVPMNENALTSILSQRERRKATDAYKGYVFCKNNGERFTGDYFSKKFKEACMEAGVSKKIHYHSLRHSFASNLAQKGVSLYAIKELLGHSSISTTEIYSHLNMDTLKEAIKKL